MKKSTAISFLLLSVIILAGCTGAPKYDTQNNFDQQVYYVYSSKIKPFPRLPVFLPNIGAITLSGDAVYFTAWGYLPCEKYVVAHSIFAMNHDGSDLRELPINLADSFPGDISFGYASINYLHIDNGGYLWLVITKSYYAPGRTDETMILHRIRKLNSSGETLLEIDINDLSQGDEFFHVSGFSLDMLGNIYIATGIDIHVLDSYGNQIFNLAAENHVTQLTRLSGGFVVKFARQPDSAMLRHIDVSHHGWGYIIMLPAEVFSVFEGNDEFDAFLIQGSNLVGMICESGELVQILNWVDNYISPGAVNNLYFLPDRSIIASLQRQDNTQDGNKPKLAHIAKMPHADIPERIPLTLGTLGASYFYFLQDAVISFNRSSTTHRLHIIDYSSFNTADNSTAGLARLTAEIVAGRSPDILDLTGLPFTEWANRGMFVDLYSFIDEDSAFSRDSIIGNLLTESEIGGRLYRIFPGFKIRTMVGASRVLGDYPGWNMDEFLETLEANPQADMPMGRFSNIDFLFFAFMNNMHEYADRELGKVNFDGDDFILLLEAAKTFSSEVETHYFSSELITSGRQIIMSITFGQFNSYKLTRSFFGNDVVLKGFPNEDRAGHLIIPGGSLAITSSGYDAEGAWEFVRSLFTDSFQRDSLMWSFPVNHAVFSERLSEAMDSRSISYLFDHNANPLWQINPISQDEADMIMAIVSSSNITFEDEVLWNIIREGALDFFRGLVSAEDAARVIQSRASIYLAERN